MDDVQRFRGGMSRCSFWLPLEKAYWSNRACRRSAPWHNAFRRRSARLVGAFSLVNRIALIFSDMRWPFPALILWMLSTPVWPLCREAPDPAYESVIAHGNYKQALSMVLDAVAMTRAEREKFRLIKGLSLENGDRHGQAEPETREVLIDPDLFLEGEEGACQGIAHELAHLRQFHRDLEALRRYYGPTTAEETIQNAYQALQDNDLASHAAAADVEAVLAQIPYASRHRLREEDVDYLRHHLKRWVEDKPARQTRANETYYLPELKRSDTRIFCRGLLHLRSYSADDAWFDPSWNNECRVR